MIRIVIVPKWNESPDFAGTKLIGTLGVSMILNTYLEKKKTKMQKT
jgi:hypothetical protein